jgi:hypothetical protein
MSRKRWKVSSRREGTGRCDEENGINTDAGE